MGWGSSSTERGKVAAGAYATTRGHFPEAELARAMRTPSETWTEDKKMFFCFKIFDAPDFDVFIDVCVCVLFWGCGKATNA